mgnify:CR=1 FL=1
MELIRYLHLNPVRAGMVSDPSRYSWSSHGAYLRGKSTSGLAVEQGLKLWGSQRNQAVKSYQRFVNDGHGVGHQEEYYEVKEQRYLGEDKFVESVHRAIDEQDENRPIEITMAEIVEVVAQESGRSAEALRRKGRGRFESRLRAQAAFVGREVGGIGLTQAAKYLRRDPSTLSLALKRLEDGIATDSDQRKRVERLCARLRQGRRRKYQISKA